MQQSGELSAPKIRALRLSLNESQTDFAIRLGVEQATVSRWERGEPVKRQLRRAIADLAGVSVASFFHNEDIEPALAKQIRSEIAAIRARLDRLDALLGEDSTDPAIRRGPNRERLSESEG